MKYIRVPALVQADENPYVAHQRWQIVILVKKSDIIRRIFPNLKTSS